MSEFTSEALRLVEKGMVEQMRFEMTARKLCGGGGGENVT